MAVYAGPMLPRRLILVALFAGCTGATGPAGDRGPAGPQGEPGARGPQGERGADGVSASAGLVWVDHQGSVVGRDPVLIDDAGVIWLLDVEIGDVNAQQYSLSYWTDAGCSGVGVMTAPIPREAVRLGNAWRVRPDSLPSQFFTVGSYSTADGGCAAFPSTIRGVRVADTGAYSIAPDSPFTGPLHRELR